MNSNEEMAALVNKSLTNHQCEKNIFIRIFEARYVSILCDQVRAKTEKCDVFISAYMTLLKKY